MGKTYKDYKWDREELRPIRKQERKRKKKSTLKDYVEKILTSPDLDGDDDYPSYS